MAKMIAWLVALNRSSNGFFSELKCTHWLHLFSNQAPTALSGQIEQAGWISCNTCELELFLVKFDFLSLRRRNYSNSFQFLLSSQRSIVCFWPPTVWSVLISHGRISFDQNLSHHRPLSTHHSAPQTPFPFPDYPQPSWLQTDAVSENLTMHLSYVQAGRIE